MYATLGQCALEDNGVEERAWWDCGMTYDTATTETLEKVNAEYEAWLATLQPKGR